MLLAFSFYFNDNTELKTPSMDGRILFENQRFAASYFYAKALWAKWSSRFQNKISQQGLLDSNLGLVVVALYAHPILSFSAKESIREQIRIAHEFV